MKKFIISLAAVCALAVGAPVFAYAGTVVTAGERQVQAEDIIITESAPGAFKKDKNIYLKCDYVSFEDGITYEVVSGDAKVKDVSTDNGIIKISIRSESTSEPAVIRLSNVKMYLDGALPEGTYALELVTEESDQFKDNMFGETYDSEDNQFDTKSLVFDDDFLIVQGSSNMENASDNESALIEEVAVSAAEGNETGAYITDSGYVMVPLRFVAEGLNSSAIVAWDDETKTVNIMLGDRVTKFTLGLDTMTINGVDVPVSTPMEIKDDRAFLSLRDVGHAMGIDDSKIYWDDETKTAYLNYKGE